MKRRRVKITGIGPVTPAGIGKDAFWKGILEPVSRVRRLERFAETGAGPFVAAEIRDFNLTRYLPGVSGKRVPRHTQFALAGAALAIEDAGLTFSAVGAMSPLVIAGAALMDFGVINKGIELIVRKGNQIGLPSTVLNASVCTISSAIAGQIGGSLRTLTMQTDCCSGLDALGHAAAMVANGEAEIAICGGAEAPIHLHPMVEFKLAGLAPNNDETPERLCRPFDRWRTTGVIGEGACMFVLEPESSPRPGYGFVSGYAFASDQNEDTLGGLEDAIRLALANGRIRAHEIDCIYAWGPGHPGIDAAEAGVLQRVFEEKLAEIPVVSIKGAVGNPLGAGGAIQAGCAALGLRLGAIPPTVNWQHPDPACPLNLSGQPRRLHCSKVLINAHGLAGVNASLILERC